jgi:hypothetical protein
MRTLLARCAMLVMGTVAGLLVAEVGLRVLGISYFEFLLIDRSVGWFRPPGAEGWFRREGESYVRINSDGLRDGEHSRAKPPNTLRIAVLGDSYSEALHVPVEQTFWSELERRLPSCPSVGGRTVEVINFGHSGYSTAQELLTWRHRARRYEPDFVVLEVYVGNDVAENSRALVAEPLRPYFVLRDGQLVLDDSFLREPAFESRTTPTARFVYGWLIPNSRLLHVANYARASADIRRRAQATAPSSGTAAPAPDGALAVYGHSDPAWEDAWRVTEALVVQTGGEVTAAGAGFLAMLVPEGSAVLPGPAVRAERAAASGIADLAYPTNRLATAARRGAVPVLDLLLAFQRHADENGVYLHGFGSAEGVGHWNQAGHRLAGELLADQVCAELR